MVAASFRLTKKIPTAARLIGGLAALVFIGTLLLSLPICGGTEPLAWNEALFTAVSALTVTGLSIITPSTDLSLVGQIVLMGLITIGGVGYMALAVLVFQILGRRLTLGDRMALQDSLGLISVKGIGRLLRQILITVLVIQGLGAALLALHWQGRVPPEDLAFYAIFHSVSAFCNAGFELFTGRPDLTFPLDNGTLAIMGGLIFLGGLGIPVLFDLIAFPKYRRISLHTRLTIITAVILVVWGMGLLMASEGRPNGVLAGMAWDRQMSLAGFQSVSARTAGLVGMPNFESLDPASQLTIMSLMFIGCAPASMGGGITTGTLIVLVLALFAYARGEATPIVGGRAIPGEMVRKAAAVLTISLFAILTSTYLLLLTHDTTLDKAMFETVSAFATSGLTLNFTMELNLFGQCVIMFMMFWGRLGALTILYAFTKSSPSRVRFPEEKILIG